MNIENLKTEITSKMVEIRQLIDDSGLKSDEVYVRMVIPGTGEVDEYGERDLGIDVVGFVCHDNSNQLVKWFSSTKCW